MFLLVLHIAAAAAAGVVGGVVVVVASVLDTFPPQTLGNQPNQPNHQIRLSIAKKAPWIFLG